MEEMPSPVVFKEQLSLDVQMKKLKELRSNVVLPFQKFVPERMIQLVEADKVVEKLGELCEGVTNLSVLLDRQLGEQCDHLTSLVLLSTPVPCQPVSVDRTIEERFPLDSQLQKLEELGRNIVCPPQPLPRPTWWQRILR